MDYEVVGRIPPLRTLFFLSKVRLQLSGFRKPLVGNKRLPKNPCFVAYSLESLSVILTVTPS